MTGDNRITPYLMGGLGNQMFQVAAALALAESTGAKCVIPSGPDQRMTRKIAYTGNVFSKIPVLNQPIQFIPYNEQSHCYTPFPRNINHKNIVLCGYYQSPKYFSHCEKMIQETFAPTAEFMRKIEEKGWLFENSLAIHVRRGDYLTLSTIHPTQPIQYYEKALEIVGRKFERVYIFSDDIAWCRAQPLFQELNPIFVEEPDYISLWIMAQCDAHIIANSTFSWWGAWLAANTRNVVYPKLWFGPGGPSTFKLQDLIPADEKWVGV